MWNTIDILEISVGWMGSDVSLRMIIESFTRLPNLITYYDGIRY